MSNQSVFDGHNDTLLNLYLPERGRGRSFFEQSGVGHVDLPRAQEGGFGGGLFACFAPPDPADGWSEEEALTVHEGGYEVEVAPAVRPEYSRGIAEKLTHKLFELEKGSGGRLKVVLGAEDLESCLREGIMAAVLHFEGAENLGTDPGALEHFYSMGLRSLGLVWSRANAFGHGVPFRFPASPDTGPGLTEEGRKLVHRCNELGILVDLSHLNENGFWDVSELSKAPLVASHSNAHALCPSTRNLTDDQLDAIRDSGGMVGVNFAVSFLREDGQNSPDTPLSEIVRHIDYLTGRMGIDHVGFGSDFDGATVPAELGDATGLPKLFEGLRGRGYGEEELKKLAHGNWVRVLRQTWGG